MNKYAECIDPYVKRWTVKQLLRLPDRILSVGCELLGAKWDEIDFKNKIWTISAERMNTGKEHRVPLTTPALAILQTLQHDRNSIKIVGEDKPDQYVFPSPKGRAPLSNMAMLALLTRMKS